MRLGLFFILLHFSLAGLFAQQYGIRYGEKKRYTSYGISVNAMNYVGELDPGPSFISPSIRYTRPSVGLVLVRRMKPALSYRATFTYGRIKGDDYVSANENGKNYGRKQRNLNFRNDIFELKGDVVFDFIGHNERYEKRHEYVPYGFVGLALFYHNPVGQVPEGFGFPDEGKWVKLKPLKTEGYNYKSLQAAIPFGLGFRYKLAKNWDLAFEVGWRFTFTDYLDDVSKEYNDPARLSALGRVMAFKSAYAAAKSPSMGTPRPITDAYGQPLLLTNGNGLTALSDYAGEYVDVDGGKQWKSDELRGDKNKDWYIITGFHLTYIPPIKTVCPKFRY